VASVGGSNAPIFNVSPTRKTLLGSKWTVQGMFPTVLLTTRLGKDGNDAVSKSRAAVAVVVVVTVVAVVGRGVSWQLCGSQRCVSSNAINFPFTLKFNTPERDALRPEYSLSLSVSKRAKTLRYDPVKCYHDPFFAKALALSLILTTRVLMRFPLIDKSCHAPTFYTRLRRSTANREP
jgi:hypothetical protein